MQQTGEQFAPDRSKVNLAALQQDLSIEMNGDFYIVLAFAEMKSGRTLTSWEAPSCCVCMDVLV